MNNCNYCKSANRCSLAKQFYNNGHCRWFRFNKSACSRAYFAFDVGFDELNIIGKSYAKKN